MNMAAMTDVAAWPMARDTGVLVDRGKPAYQPVLARPAKPV